MTTRIKKGYIGRVMVRLLMQYLALGAMMASVMNAQCAVSCALESITPTSVAQSDGAVVSEASDHSCCPHPGTGATCSNVSETTAGARLEVSGGPIFNWIVSVDPVFIGQGHSPLSAARRPGLPDCDPPGLNRPSSISILRI